MVGPWLDYGSADHGPTWPIVKIGPTWPNLAQRQPSYPRQRPENPPCISHPLARTRDGPSLDGRGTTGTTEDLLETKRGISKATRNYRYKNKESLAFAASRLNVVAFLA